MSRPSSGLLEVLRQRGFLHQCTDLAGLEARIARGPVTGYIGFDATADSLHVGNLVMIMMLHWMQQTGHRPIVLMGGGTTKIGDPSGRDETRQLASDAEINGRIAKLRGQFNNFLHFGEGPQDAILANNADWLDGLAYIPFLRDVGRHFSVNRMLTFDSVKLRLDREQPLSFLEFNYMILQAYDFVELHRRHGCILQLGGSDQWGNIVSGIDLGRRVLEADLFGFTTPLIQTSSGAKMGKTASGAVWLSAERLGAYEYWQYWRNTDDADVGRFLKLFTTLPMTEIARLEALQGAEINDAKKILANAATAMLHGPAAASQAETTALKVFEQGNSGDGLPLAPATAEELESGLGLVEILRRLGFAATNGEALRLIRGGGIYINAKVVADERRLVTTADLAEDGTARISKGKKQHGLLRRM